MLCPSHTSSTIITQEIDHESIDGKSLDLQKLASRDGAKLLSANFNPRLIRLRGYIKGTSQSNLESNIDDFKEVLNATTKNLDIGYAGGTRRYVCDMARITLIRLHYNITYAEWEAEFICAKTPFGKPLDTTSMEYSLTSLATAWGSFVATGNYKPKPLIIITFTEVAGVNTVRVRNATTGDWIEVEKSSEYANGNIIRIDCDNYTVTINGVANDYAGFFPQFLPEGNDLRV